MIALAKARPGEILYASSGHGTNLHLAMELFASMAQIRLVHVPYAGKIFPLDLGLCKPSMKGVRGYGTRGSETDTPRRDR